MKSLPLKCSKQVSTSVFSMLLVEDNYSSLFSFSTLEYESRSLDEAASTKFL